VILSCDRFQNRAFTYSDEMFEEDDEIKESDNPLYSSRFSANYFKILDVAWFSSFLDALEESRILFFHARRNSTHISEYLENYVSWCEFYRDHIRPVHVWFRP